MEARPATITAEMLKRLMDRGLSLDGPNGVFADAELAKIHSMWVSGHRQIALASTWLMNRLARKEENKW